MKKIDTLGLKGLDEPKERELIEKEHQDDIPIPGGWAVPKKGIPVPMVGTFGFGRLPALSLEYRRLKLLRELEYGPPMTGPQFVAHIFCILFELAFFIVFGIGLVTVILWLK